MGKKKSASRVAPNISSASSLSVAAATQKSNTSSILRSAFSPSRFQLSLFASVIQSLDSHQLRIHDTATGRLRCEHTASRAEITALDWGYYGAAYRIPDEQPSKKKRRKMEDTNGAGHSGKDAVVAFGTNQSQVHIYSPAEAKVLATLSGGHTYGIRDFRFVDFGIDADAWSLGGDDKLVQWNLRDGTILRTIASPTTPATALFPLHESLLVAANATYLIDTREAGTSSKLGEGSSTTTYLASNDATQAKKPTAYLAAFENNRHVNVYDISSGKIVGSLVAEQDVSFVTSNGGAHDTSVLGVVTTQGVVELFSEPFGFMSITTDKDVNLKTKRQQMTKKATATIHISKTALNKATMPVVALSFQDSDLVLAYVENGAALAFERMPWMDEQQTGLLLRGQVSIEKAGTLLGIDNAGSNGVKEMSKMQVDESRAVVSRGADTEAEAMAVDEPEVIDISSAEDEESDESDEEDQPPSAQKPSSRALTNGVHEDEEMEDAASAEDGPVDEEDGEEEDDQEDGELSFGERLRQNATDTVDVAAAFSNGRDQELVQTSKRVSKLPSGMSLGTVLSQSLRTNDITLLESCLHEQDLNVIRATIARLDSSLATILLKKLAERLHSRPGRAGSLMVWVQWTLVAHGGYLGSQPDVVKQLASLHRVVKERASSLQPLLSLKGKLDMLEAQMNLRRSMQSRFGITEGASNDEEGVIYVEGQEESDSEADAAASDGASDDEDIEGSEDEDDDDEDEEMDDIDVDVDEDSADGSGNELIDDEASETSADDGSDGDELADEVDHDDVDSYDEISEEEVPGPKVSSKSKLTNGTLPKKR